jgi:DNA-binding NarL/FixJ family response regulator
MSLTVLIAEDQELVCRGIRALLEARPEWKVCGEAKSGSEAVEKASKLRPDLILLRVRLPDMSGAEAIQKIMNVCPECKILGLARQGSGELAAKALAAGASGLAMTSDTESDFLLTLQNIGKNRPSFSPEALRLLQGHLSTGGGTSEPLPTDLTPRELEILKLVARGQTSREVARSLNISIRTVDVHRANIMRRLRFVSFSELVQFAIRHKLTER